MRLERGVKGQQQRKKVASGADAFILLAERTSSAAAEAAGGVDCRLQRGAPPPRHTAATVGWAIHGWEAVAGDVDVEE
jgi:hypothetical protein